MVKELDEDREESQDPEVEFAIAGAVRECGGLDMIKVLLLLLSSLLLAHNLSAFWIVIYHTCVLSFYRAHKS